MTTYFYQKGAQQNGSLVKSALSITDTKLPPCELISHVSKFCRKEWQDIWDCCEENKLHSVCPAVCNIKAQKSNKSTSHFDSVLINRLRIGHCHLTHSYLLSDDDRPTCTFYSVPLTVKYILLDCMNLRDIHEKYFTVSTSLSVVEVLVIIQYSVLVVRSGCTGNVVVLRVACTK